MKFDAVRAVNQQRQKGEGEANNGFADALFEDLSGQMDKLPLERFCKKGGWPVNAKISTIAILEDVSERLTVVLYIGFTETGAACCSGDNFAHEHFEELSMVVDKTDWTCDFPSAV